MSITAVEQNLSENTVFFVFSFISSIKIRDTGMNQIPTKMNIWLNQALLSIWLSISDADKK